MSYQFPSARPVSSISFFLNAFALAGICTALLAAFFFQLVRAEIPCPLCMLQRVGLMFVGFGFAMNLRFGTSAVHYAVVILSAAVGAGASLRQILLHIVPNDPGFGPAIFGYHMYTWGFIAFMGCIVFSAVMLFIDRAQLSGPRQIARTTIGTALIALLVLLSAGNIVSNVLTCGFAPCDDNPVGYIFQRGLFP